MVPRAVGGKSTVTGCRVDFTHKLSGVRQPPGCAALIDFVRAGVAVVVIALDRHDRSRRRSSAPSSNSRSPGCCAHSGEGIDFSYTAGRMLAGIFTSPRSANAQLQPGKPLDYACLLYTSPSPRDGLLSRMPS